MNFAIKVLNIASGFCLGKGDFNYHIMYSFSSIAYRYLSKWRLKIFRSGNHPRTFVKGRLSDLLEVKCKTW